MKFKEGDEVIISDPLAFKNGLTSMIKGLRGKIDKVLPCDILKNGEPVDCYFVRIYKNKRIIWVAEAQISPCSQFLTTINKNYNI